MQVQAQNKTRSLRAIPRARPNSTGALLARGFVSQGWRADEADHCTGYGR